MQVPRRVTLTLSSLALAAGSVFTVGAVTPAHAQTTTTAAHSMAPAECWGHHCWRHGWDGDGGGDWGDGGGGNWNWNENWNDNWGGGDWGW
jgi:hypothetical protein